MDNKLVARELLKVARLLAATPWDSLLDRVDVGRRNVDTEKSVTSFAPRLKAAMQRQAAGELGVSANDLKREYSAYLTLVDPEVNANKYHYYIIFSRPGEAGEVVYSSWNCSGRIGIVERGYNLTDKAYGMSETASWPQAMKAVDLHKNRKLAKKYVESPMIRG